MSTWMIVLMAVLAVVVVLLTAYAIHNKFYQHAVWMPVTYVVLVVILYVFTRIG